MAKATPIPFPMYDAEKLMAAQQRNLDAFASAGQIMFDGAKAIAQRQGEMMQASVNQFVTVGQGAMTAQDMQPGEQMAKAKSVYETAVGNAQELTEIAMKAQSEAADVLTKCIMANVDDLKSLAKAA